MVNKYFKAACALIFWMELYCLICKPVPTTTAFQKRCQIYYKRELEQNSSLAMHHGHYANTTMEHISQSISSPLEMPLPNCLSCGEPHRAEEWGGGFQSVGHDVRRFLTRYRDWAQDGDKINALPEMRSVQESSGRVERLGKSTAGFKEAAAPRAIIGPVMYDCHLPH